MSVPSLRRCDYDVTSGRGVPEGRRGIKGAPGEESVPKGYRGVKDTPEEESVPEGRRGIKDTPQEESVPEGGQGHTRGREGPGSRTVVVVIMSERVGLTRLPRQTSRSWGYQKDRLSGVPRCKEFGRGAGMKSTVRVNLYQKEETAPKHFSRPSG